MKKTMPLRRQIFIAGPWGPKGGGMYKVSDYLVQSQALGRGSADLCVLDTRGNRSALFSMVVLWQAIWTLACSRFCGRLAGVHVNMAERLSVWRKGMVIAFVKAMRVPVVLHLHAAQLHSFYKGLPPLLQWAIRKIFHWADAVVVLGPQAERFVVDTLKVPSSRVSIVINGVPQPAIVRRASSLEQPFQILFLGNLSERKGVSDLLRALASPALRSLSWQASIAGGGDVKTYAALAQSLGLAERSCFPGWVDQQQAAQLIASADLLVLPSYDEGLPLVILEALSQSVAVLSTPVGEIPKMLCAEKEVMLVPPGDIEAIASAMVKLIQHPEIRRALELHGHEAYDRRFSIEVFFAAIATIHQQYFGVCAASATSA